MINMGLFKDYIELLGEPCSFENRQATSIERERNFTPLTNTVWRNF
jgi:hypothetical protein